MAEMPAGNGRGGEARRPQRRRGGETVGVSMEERRRPVARRTRRCTGGDRKEKMKMATVLGRRRDKEVN